MVFKVCNIGNHIYGDRKKYKLKINMENRSNKDIDDPPRKMSIQSNRSKSSIDLGVNKKKFTDKKLLKLLKNQIEV